MVARRLAEDSVQPASFAFSNDNAKWAEWKIGLYPAGRQQSAVIPLLMRAQDQDGWISRATIETIADMLEVEQRLSDTTTLVMGCAPLLLYFK